MADRLLEKEGSLYSIKVYLIEIIYLLVKIYVYKIYIVDLKI